MKARSVAPVPLCTVSVAWPRRSRQLGQLCAALFVWSSVAAATPSPQLDLPRVRLTAGLHQIDAQVALSPEQRGIGLMWRREMPQHEGMLFVFEQPAVHCFWMQNTPLPLTAAFLDDSGTIVNLADMKPHSTESHCAAQPVRFVLEMNQGWFARKGLKAGAQLRGAPFSPR